MPHYRSGYRATALAALVAHTRFAAFTAPKVWPNGLDVDGLPLIGVLTPQDRSERDTHSSSRRGTLLQVGIRRLGSEDVEDELDTDSTYVEAIVIAALQTYEVACVLEETSLVTNTTAELNVGTLVMNFRLTSFRPVATLPINP